MTQHRQDRHVVFGGRCELGISRLAKGAVSLQTAQRDYHPSAPQRAAVACSSCSSCCCSTGAKTALHLAALQRVARRHSDTTTAQKASGTWPPPRHAVAMFV